MNRPYGFRPPFESEKSCVSSPLWRRMGARWPHRSSNSIFANSLTTWYCLEACSFS